jgi:hypothetical protein
MNADERRKAGMRDEVRRESRSQNSEFRIQKKRESVNAALRRLFWILDSDS